MPEPLPRPPQTAWAIFWVFTRLALQGFGGVLAVAQRELVERRGWLTRAQFAESLSLAQVLPGPNIVNLALMIGDRHLGWRGAAAALAGLLTVPLVLVLGLAALYRAWAAHPVAVGALRGMGAVAAGLIVAMGIKLLPTLKDNAMGRGLSVAFFVVALAMVAYLRLPLPAVVLGLGGLACAVAWMRLR
jgi:chromate transporter